MSCIVLYFCPLSCPLPGNAYSKTANGIEQVTVQPNVEEEPTERFIVSFNPQSLEKSSRLLVCEQPRCDDGQRHRVAEVVNDDVNQDQDVDWTILDLDLQEVLVDPELPEMAPQEREQTADAQSC